MIDPWFEIERIDDDTFVIAEPSHVRSHLIIGDERAVLFDTGLGVRPIRPVVAELTDRPVLAVASHHHFDHVGGNHEFDEVAIHHAGAELLAQGPPPGWLTAYWEGFLDYVERFSPDASTARPLPADFAPQHPDFRPSAATRLLDDGEVLPLGGRDLRVVHVPGHTQDSICLVDESHGFLFGGDAIDTGGIYAHLPTADPAQFVASLRRLDALLPSTVVAVLSPHSRTGRHGRDVIGREADAIAAALTGEVVFESGKDCFRQAACVASIGDFAIYLAPVSP
ncbi:MBL fold metallo-hydrolase [Streptosporangium sp. NPDC006013]|uniref:MBL fold metallo-hydrolase n=1 Tax=Streptosporangium sp. NPDC006013 TaxID=3155596 RepID=UPI0033B33EA5